jgi:hypothetical protein
MTVNGVVQIILEVTVHGDNTNSTRSSVINAVLTGTASFPLLLIKHYMFTVCCIVKYVLVKMLSRQIILYAPLNRLLSFQLIILRRLLLTVIDS